MTIREDEMVERLRRQIVGREAAKREGHLVATDIHVTPEDAVEIVGRITTLSSDRDRLREALGRIERIAEKHAGVSGARSLQTAMCAIAHASRAALTGVRGG